MKYKKYFLLLLFLSSCGSLEQERALMAEWGRRNKQQHQALGEKIYTKDYEMVFTAIITGLADAGLSVRNMERQSGYILAEGPSPLSAEEQVAYGKEICKELNKVSPRVWQPSPGNATKAATITIKRFKDRETKVKIRISNINIHGNSRTTYYSSYPPLLEAEYRKLWEAIEKQIFLDENLDK